MKTGSQCERARQPVVRAVGFRKCGIQCEDANDRQEHDRRQYRGNFETAGLHEDASFREAFASMYGMILGFVGNSPDTQAQARGTRAGKTALMPPQVVNYGPLTLPYCCMKFPFVPALRPRRLDGHSVLWNVWNA